MKSTLLAVRYDSCVVIPLFLLYFVLSSEPSSVFTAIGAQPGIFGWVTLYGVSNLFSSLLTFLLIVHIGALTTSVVSNIKIVAVVIISVIGAQTSYNVANYFGFGLFFPGVVLYSWFMFVRRFDTPRDLPALEAGMAVATKIDKESSALLNNEAPHGPTRCCIVQ